MAPGTDLSFLASEIETAHEIKLPTKPVKVSLATLSQGAAVLDPSLISTDFDLLRFEAAAYDQLHVSTSKNDQHYNSSNPIAFSSLLISSPYNNPGHYLHLASLDTPNQILSKALTALRPLRPDYATAPYTEALNLDTIVDLVRKFAADEGFQWREQSLYVVSFHSKLKAVIDNELLYALDYESHREACESGGLLKYWFGKPSEERRNLATCKCSPNSPLAP